MATVTIEPVLLEHQWKKDDTNFFRIRITLHRQQRYIKTNILIHRDQLAKNGRIKDSTIRQALEDFVRKIEESVSALNPYALDNMTADDVVEYIGFSQRKTFALDFIAYGREHIAKKSRSTRATYESALKALAEFVGSDTLDIGEITSSLLRQFEAWLRKKHGENARAVSSYTAALRYIHNQARLQYNDEEKGYVPIRNPYQFYKPPIQRPVAHRAVDPEIIDKMLAMRESLSGRERVGVDVFLISFALMGMNCPDLYACSAPKDGILIYYRQKTRDRRSDHAEMRVKIDPLVVGLLKEYQSTDGSRAFSFAESYTTYAILGENVNDGLAKFARRIGHEGGLTLYQARHTWATAAYRCGIGKDVINDCLCHVDKAMKVTDIYIAKEWSVLWDANHKVLERFRWP